MALSRNTLLDANSRKDNFKCSFQKISMTLRDLQEQALQLSISERWRLVQSVLSSIEQETQVFNSTETKIEPIADLNPWTQSLIGVIQIF